MRTKDRPKPARRRMLVIGLYVLFAACLALGVYLVVRPQLRTSERQKVSNQIVEAFENGIQDFEVDPNALPVEEEESFTETIGQLFGDVFSETQKAEQDRLKIIGILQIPKIDLVQPILEGCGELQLRYGAGRHPALSELGQPGRSVLFGHRMLGFGEIFNRFGELSEGDTISVQDTDNNHYLYSIEEIEVVSPYALSKTLKKQKDGDRLVLVTCTPIETAANRMVVWCVPI